MKPYLIVLKSFMSKMNSWEIMCSEREKLCATDEMDYDDAEELGMKEYMAIFSNHCSRKASPRCYTFSEPPNYEPEGELVESIQNENSEDIEVVTQQNYCFRKKHIYNIVLENGQWRILNKKILLDTGKCLDTPL